MANNYYFLQGSQTVDASADAVGDIDFFTLTGNENHATGHAGLDYFTVSGQFNTVDGGGGNDQIHNDANGSYNSLNGGSGDDTVFGLATDTLNGGGGAHDVAVLDMSAEVHAYTLDLSTVGTTGSQVLYDGTTIADFDALVITTSTLADVIDTGANGDIVANGGGGDDTLYGHGRNDVLMGGAGTDVVAGNDGDDILYAFSPTSYNGYNFSPGTDDRTSRDSLIGGAGNDQLHSSLGVDVMDGGTGTDLVVFNSVTTSVHHHVTTYNGVDLSLNNSGGGVAKGGAGKDVVLNIENIAGSAGNDSFSGNASNNNLSGQGGADKLFGGGGADVLDGGYRDGAIDTFIYTVASQSTAAHEDTIYDFELGIDKVDLHKIDADHNKANGDTAFHFTSAFGAAGDATLTYLGSSTEFAADLNGDGTADMKIYLFGVHATAADFIA